MSTSGSSTCYIYAPDFYAGSDFLDPTNKKAAGSNSESLYTLVDKAGNSHLGVPHTSKEESGRRHEEILKAGLPAQDLADLIRQLSEQMHTAAEQLQFELAARLRDEIRDLKKELRQMTEASK